MTALESIILSYVANALWQVPLLWGAGWLAARAFRRLGPSAEHRVWVSVLVMQAVLPAAPEIPWGALRGLLDFSGGAFKQGQAQVSVITGPGVVFGNPHLTAGLLVGLTVVYACITAWFAARFMWKLHAMRGLVRGATAVTLPEDAAEWWAQSADAFEVKGAVLGTSPRIYGPITVGIMRKLVLMPAEMLAVLPDSELRAAIAHEFAHMRRHDFFKNLIYELLSLPVRFHPFVSFARERVTETREMVCDEMAAGLEGHHEYARSLLRLASMLVDGMRPRTSPAIGIFDATTFERRVMRLTEKPSQPSTLRRFTVTAAGTLLGASICVTALAFSVHVNAFAAGSEQNPPKATGPVAVKADIMQNQIVHKVPPVYPEEAKKERIQGKVELNAVIGKDGAVKELTVSSGPKELRQSALDAVRQWTYKPFLLNGAPVDVKTTIHVTYSLIKF